MPQNWVPGGPFCFFGTQVQSVPCLVSQSSLVKFCSNCWICQSCFMDYSKLLYVYFHTLSGIFLTKTFCPSLKYLYGWCLGSPCQSFAKPPPPTAGQETYDASHILGNSDQLSYLDNESCWDVCRLFLKH